MFMLVLLVAFARIENAFSSRSASRSVISPALPDAAIDLNSSNFAQAFKDYAASYAIVEFFAHWCPACRNYKPHYDKVARLFNGPDAVHPGIIFMARVDCAQKTNVRLCDRFSVRHYPMLLWGPSSVFATDGLIHKGYNSSKVHPITDARTAELLLDWINKQIGSSFSFEDQRYQNEDVARLNTSDPGQIGRALYDIEETTANVLEIISEMGMVNFNTRASLIHFLQLLTAHHPSKRCRWGSAEILSSLDDLLGSSPVSNAKNISMPFKDFLKRFRVCGKDVPRGYWIFCRGSKSETRGFSCGLWILFHSLSVRVDDGESDLVFRAICDFIHNFFVCEDCRRHFHQMCLSVSIPLNTTRNLALWLWDAHNQVNKRLLKEEAESGTGDPKYPKIMWPSKTLCPMCYVSPDEQINGSLQINWNASEVFKFLESYYGEKLISDIPEFGIISEVSVDEEVVATTNAVAVPVGAAFAIAVASCTFGGLACLWRSRQKNRRF